MTTPREEGQARCAPALLASSSRLHTHTSRAIFFIIITIIITIQHCFLTHRHIRARAYCFALLPSAFPPPPLPCSNPNISLNCTP